MHEFGEVWASVRGKVALALALVLLALLLSAVGDGQKKPFSSVEVRFADTSSSGLAIVPASCPSEPPHWEGDTGLPNCGGTPQRYACNSNNQCVADSGGPYTSSNCNNACGTSTQRYACNSNNQCVADSGGPYTSSNCNNACSTSPPCTYLPYCDGLIPRVRNTDCSITTYPACGYLCSAGSCQSPPAAQFIPFVGIRDDDSTFQATGDLQVIPNLVQQNDTTLVYWKVANVSICTVTGSNSQTLDPGCSGTICYSGDHGQPTIKIKAQTYYTLSCTSLPGATPPTISESDVVNITPLYCEPGVPDCPL